MRYKVIDKTVSSYLHFNEAVVTISVKVFNFTQIKIKLFSFAQIKLQLLDPWYPNASNLPNCF